MHDLQAESGSIAEVERALQSLTAAGLDQADAPRFAFLKALHARAQRHGDAVRAGLVMRLQQHLVAYTQMVTPSLMPQREPQPNALCPEVRVISPLSDLLAALKAPGHEQKPSTPGQETQFAESEDLKSLRTGRSAWVRLRVDHEVARSSRAADEALGPLNSQWLILRSLQRLQALAPAYLEHFVKYAEALHWLEGSDGQENSRALLDTPPAAQISGKGARRKPIG